MIPAHDNGPNLYTHNLLNLRSIDKYLSSILLKLMSKNFRASKTPNFDTLVTFKLLCEQVNQPSLVNQ